MLTTLSYSAGVQSHCLLEMVLRGDLPRSDNFVVITADPGMEDERSMEFRADAARRCEAAGIPFLRVQGGNLYQDLLTFRERGVTRMDQPPYWTKDPTTFKEGKLSQRCTRFYKLEPMRRALRRHLYFEFGVPLHTSKLPKVETWIGFAADETDRCSPSDVQYIRNRYPLIELGMDRAKVEGYYLKHGLAKPPRSVCVACFANGLAYLEAMYHERPDDWDKAVAVDDAVRDMSQLGVRQQVFVSKTLVPLRDLPGRDWLRGTKEGVEHRCNSGVCFL